MNETLTEEWRDIKGYEGAYQVSNLGRVRSLDRILRDGRRRKGRILKPALAGARYEFVNLCRDGKRKSRYVHQLVAEAFIGPRPEGQQVRHGPNGKADNSVENLCYGTPSQNNGADKRRDGTLAVGERIGNSKLTTDDVRKICRLRSTGLSLRSLADKFGVSEATICRTLKGTTWSHVDTPKSEDDCRLGELSNFSKLTETEVRRIRELSVHGWTQRRIANRFGVTQSNISNIVNRKSWTHLSA